MKFVVAVAVTLVSLLGGVAHADENSQLLNSLAEATSQFEYEFTENHYIAPPTMCKEAARISKVIAKIKRAALNEEETAILSVIDNDLGGATDVC